MKKTNPALFRPSAARVLNSICEDVRHAYVKCEADCGAIERFYHGQLSADFSCTCDGECYAIKSLVRDAVAHRQGSSDFSILMHVFDDLGEVVQHLIDRLHVEAQVMRTPSRRGNAVLCYRRALGASYDELTEAFGFPESTLEGVFRRNRGFIDYIGDRLAEDYEGYSEKVWDSLNDLWKLWCHGDLPPDF